LGKFKGVILIGFLVVAAGFAPYNAIFHGMVNVKRDGWRTYEEAPVAFVVTTLSRCKAAESGRGIPAGD
jgi:hypothetical protein